jgi:hypothetical protein
MREIIPLAATQGDFRLVLAATSDLVTLLWNTGHLDKALAHCDEVQAYTRQAGLGRWSQLGDEGHCLQVLTALGRCAEVLAAVEGLREGLRALPEASAQEEMVHVLGVQMTILNAGEVAAARLHCWEVALALNAEAVALKEAHGASALEVARTRFNAHLPLLRLRQALRQPDLPPLEAPPGPPPSDGDIARATLHYLAERDAPFRTAIQHLAARGGVPPEPPTRDAGLFMLGALVLLAMHADVEVRKAPAKGWYFHFRIKPLPPTPLGKVLHLLYSKFLG